MDHNDFRVIRSEILEGRVKSRENFLVSLKPVFRSFLRERDVFRPVGKRKIKIMENIALDLLYFNKFPKGAEPVEYLNKIFGELFN
ncbi:MAG: hypothetical protein LWY06_03460 [Firmicutes bacterium]|nr:hypothetical protein [Bacillota bacterium]